VEGDPPKPRLPDGIDDDEYRRIRALMRASVLKAWKGSHEVIAGLDPWDIVDEAWISMAADKFESKGPFLPHALAVARNKAIDAQRRVEARRRDRSIDAPLANELAGSRGADVDYFRSQDEVDAIKRLALWEEGIYASGTLTEVQKEVFIAVRIDRKSRAAVGRELDPPLTGQRVGQIAAEAFIKLQAYVRRNEGSLQKETSLGKEGGAARGRR
jgi:DNA-directed RNA polymerase specialized sigma24 family protein